MRIPIPEKVRTREILKNDIRSNITNLNHTQDGLVDTGAILANAVDGSFSGADREMLDFCRQARQEIDNALQLLERCLQIAEELDVTEEVEVDG